jgi:hypothetical protein
MCKPPQLEKDAAPTDDDLAAGAALALRGLASVGQYDRRAQKPCVALAACDVGCKAVSQHKA